MMLPGLTADERRDLLLSVGSHRNRRVLSPVEVGELFSKSIEAGASLSDCSEAVHFDGTTMVSRFVRLLGLVAEIRYTVGWGASDTTISFSAANEIARLNPAQHQEAVSAVLSKRLSSVEVKQLVQLLRRSNKDVTVGVEEVIRLRPIVDTRYIIVGAITDDSVVSRLVPMKQSDRDALVGSQLRSVIGCQFEMRLGSHHFTMVTTDPDCARRLAEEGLESMVSAEIASCLDEGHHGTHC